MLYSLPYRTPRSAKRWLVPPLHRGLLTSLTRSSMAGDRGSTPADRSSTHHEFPGRDCVEDPHPERRKALEAAHRCHHEQGRHGDDPRAEPRPQRHSGDVPGTRDPRPPLHHVMQGRPRALGRAAERPSAHRGGESSGATLGACAERTAYSTGMLASPTAPLRAVVAILPITAMLQGARIDGQVPLSGGFWLTRS